MRFMAWDQPALFIQKIKLSSSGHEGGGTEAPRLWPDEPKEPRRIAKKILAFDFICGIIKI
jgi:hypothetical protein